MSLALRRLLPACAAVLAAALPASPAAAATTTPRALPTVERAVDVDSPQRRDCTVLDSGAGVATQSWRAPDEGFVAVRLRGTEGDWDLALFDALSGRKLDASNAFGANELATARVADGQAVRIQTCRRSGSAASVPMSIDFTAVRVPAPEHPLQLVEIEVPTLWERARLASLGLDLSDHSDGRTQHAILHSPEDALTLQRNGFRFEVRIPDMAAQDEADRLSELRFARSGQRAGTPGGRTTYRTYDEYLADLKAMVEENPGIVRPVTLPHGTIEGRDIVGVEIATDVHRTDDGRPVYVQIGVHHAREWPSGEAAIEFGLDLLQRGKAGEPRWKHVLDNARTFVVPIQNPDGFIASRTVGSLPNDNLPATPGTPQQIVGGVGYRRKNCRPLSPLEDATPCAARQQNDNGVDTNRNYGEQWGGPGTSSDQTSLVYHGEGPFSEPETQAIRDWLLGLQPTLLITNHTFTGLILRPPGTGDQGPAPDEDRMRRIGDAMARETDYVSQYSYQLYDTTGTTDDWIYGGLASFSFTPEIGKINFHPSYTDDFVPEYDGRQEVDRDTGEPTGRKLGGLREAFLLAGEAAVDPDSHSVIRGTAPAGRTLRIKRTFVTRTSERPNDDDVQNPVQELTEDRQSTLTVPADGTYVWHTAPSTRPFEREQVPWTLTCEDGSGGVLERREVFVARAQQVRVDLACGGGSPAGGQTTVTCEDRFAPRTTFRRRASTLSRRRTVIRGRSADRGCRDADGTVLNAAGVRRVSVSVARITRRGRCQFLRRNGRLARARGCLRRMTYVRARGARRWRLVVRRGLPRGKYKIWVRGVDRAGNVERKDERRNFWRARIR